MINTCSQQTGLAGLFPCRALLCFWDGERQGQQEWSSTLTSSPSHPIPARLSPFLAAHSPQSLAQTSPVQGVVLCLSLRYGARGEANPANPGQRCCAAFLYVPKRGTERTVAITTCHPILAPYYTAACPHQGTGPNLACCRKAGMALALPVVPLL